jgi:hypothetical protein
MTASGQRVFLNLIEDSSEPFEVAKSILKSPLELSRTIICHLFSNDLSGLYEQVDEIKGFAAGVTRAMDERAHYRLADYYMMLFPFQQWFHSSYRARQGKALEALLDQFFRGYTSFPDLITDKKRRKEFLVTECGLTELSEVGDIDVMATTRDKSMVIILQMRSRDDTGGTTAKGSLVDALKQLMRVKEAPRKQVLYLIGIWDPRGYEQHDSTVKKILSSIQKLLKIGDFTPEEAVLSGFTSLVAQWCAAKDEEQKRQLLSEISEELEKGVQLKQNLKLRLAYGKDKIIDAICGWGSEQSSSRLNSSTAQTQEVQPGSDIDVASARRSNESPVSEHSQAQEARDALKKVMDLVTQWDDLWLAYAAASMEIDVIKTRDLSNTSILVDLLQKLDADSKLELDSIESVQRWVDEFAKRVHSQWDQDSIPFRTPRDQYLYIRDMMYLYAIYRKYCKSSKDLPRSREQVHHTETETVVKEPPGYYQPSLLDVEPPDSNSEVTLVSFRDLAPEITDTTYLTHGLFYYPAKFIPQVPNYCIRQYTKSGDWVMDPFAGSGTVGLEAALLGRNSILLDINPLLEHIVPIKILFKHCSVAMIPNPTADTPPQSPPHTPNIHNNTKTAMQVINHTLRQHLTTRQTQPPTTHTIPKLALDYRNHRLHLPTLTIQPARFDTLHDLRTQHARPRPQPPSTPNRRYHIRPLYIATIKPCVRQQPKPRRTPPAYHIPTCLGTQRR